MRLTSTAIIFSTLAAPAMAEIPDIVVDFPVTASLVQQVLGDLGEVRTIMDAGSDPHHYQMRPSDASAMESAGLLVWIGPELTPWLGRASDNLGDGRSLALLHTDGTEVRGYHDMHEDDHGGHEGHEHGDHTHEHEHEHEHEHSEHAGHEHKHEEHSHDDHGHDSYDHDHDGADPHAWLDPANARNWLNVIAHALAELDPQNDDTYTTNAQLAADRVTAVEQNIAASLKNAHDQRFVVFHDAYGYFTEHFGLQPAIAVSLGDASSPSAARIAEIRENIAESGAACAFPEFGHDPTLIDSATEGHDVKTGGALDPAGRDIKEGAELYEKLIKNLGNTFADCLTATGN